ncbi:MAG: iron-sulfur cluster repair di-iron protein [Ferruginibacter sp.]
MINLAEQTLASIVTANHQTASILEKYSLDFCCKGKRTLAQACTEKGIVVDDITRELEATVKTELTPGKDFTEMSADQLIRHILIHHHFYVKQIMPVIEEHLIKVAFKHGEHYPYMKETLQLFTHLKNEMYLHLQKEEVILFPRIKELESVVQYNQQRHVDKNFIYGPAGVMEAEHDEAGAIMYRIREITGNYEAPEGACTTFKLVLEELKAFEQDLHQHVHLENNVLFPKAENILDRLNG